MTRDWRDYLAVIIVASAAGFAAAWTVVHLTKQTAT